MSTSQTRQTGPQEAPAAGARGANAAHVEILELARSASSEYGFFTKAFRAIARSFSSPYAALCIRFSSEEVQDDYHSGPTDPAFWKPSLQEFLLDSLAFSTPRAKLLSAKKANLRIAFLSAPIFDSSGSMIGALALVIPNVTEHNVHQRLATLESLTRLTSFAAEFIGSAGRDDGSGRDAAPNKALARAASMTTMEELAFSITNTLRNKLNCEQVALGLVVRNRVRIISISGLDTVRRQSPGVRCLQGAMEECLDRQAPIVCQQGEEWSNERLSSEHRLHRQWRGAAKGDAVASVPLSSGGATAAILSLRRRPDRPFTREHIEEIRAHVEPFAPALLLTRRAHRGLARHVWDSGHDLAHAFSQPGRVGMKVLAGVCVLTMGWFFFGTTDYDITVPCVVAPAQVRHITVPFDGVLASADVIAGDLVRRGDVLCLLDQEDLHLQRAELASALAVLEREKDRAMADDDPGRVQLALANQRLARVKLRIVQRRIEQATVRAPLDGLVVSGDLRKRIGGVVSKGEPLFEVSPLGEWTLELEVPDAVSADLASGLSGVFAGYARPERAQSFTLNRVRPLAEVRDTRNVYVAEARMDTAVEWMRPGMEGVAKVRVGPRRVWWVALHRVVDYLHLKLWL